MSGITPDPTGEGSAWQPTTPAPGSDAENTPEDTIVLPHDGMVLLGSRQAFADASRRIVGVYMDRLGKPQEIHRSGLYAQHLKRAMSTHPQESAAPAAQERQESDRERPNRMEREMQQKLDLQWEAAKAVEAERNDAIRQRDEALERVEKLEWANTRLQRRAELADESLREEKARVWKLSTQRDEALRDLTAAENALADRRVVAPEITDEQALELCPSGYDPRRVIAWVCENAHAISPDEVVVRREELEALESVAAAAEAFRSGPWPDGEMSAALNMLANAAVGLKAIRSQGEPQR